jgi:hypothetical protein
VFGGTKPCNLNVFELEVSVKVTLVLSQEVTVTDLLKFKLLIVA